MYAQKQKGLTVTGMQNIQVSGGFVPSSHYRKLCHYRTKDEDGAPPSHTTYAPTVSASTTVYAHFPTVPLGPI